MDDLLSQGSMDWEYESSYAYWCDYCYPCDGPCQWGMKGVCPASYPYNELTDTRKDRAIHNKLAADHHRDGLYTRMRGCYDEEKPWRIFPGFGG